MFQQAYNLYLMRDTSRQSAFRKSTTHGRKSKDRFTTSPTTITNSETTTPVGAIAVH